MEGGGREGVTKQQIECSSNLLREPAHDGHCVKEKSTDQIRSQENLLL